MTISTLGLTGARCASLQEITLSGKPDWFDGALARLNNDGYAVVEGAVPAALCRQLSDELEAAVARTGSTRPPNFEGAGWRVGHVALTETDSESGATELVPGSHAVSLRYWQLLCEPWCRAACVPPSAPATSSSDIPACGIEVCPIGLIECGHWRH